MKKIYFVATVPKFFNFFRGQLSYLSSYFDVTLVSSPEKELYEISKRENVLSAPIQIKRSISLMADLLSLINLISLFKKDKPDIVHGNTPKGALLSLLAAKITGVKTRIYMCHGLRYQSTSGLLRILLKFMEHLTCKFATHIISVSDGVRSEMIKDKLCKPDKNSVLDYGSCNGIDGEYFKNDASLTTLLKDRHNDIVNFSHNSFIFTFIGRIVEDKGVNEMVAAFVELFKKYSNIKLLLVGDFEEDNAINTMTYSIIRDNDNIFNAGYTNDVRPLLGISDVLLLPSYREGFGMVLIEAGAMSVPVICSDIIGCRSAVIENVNGLFCLPNNMLSLKDKMEMLLMDNNLRNSIKTNTRSSVLERFEASRVWTLYRNFYIKAAQ